MNETRKQEVELLAGQIGCHCVAVRSRVEARQVALWLATRTGLTIAGANSRLYRYWRGEIDEGRLLESRQEGMRRRRQSIKRFVGSPEWDALGDGRR